MPLLVAALLALPFAGCVEEGEPAPEGREGAPTAPAEAHAETERAAMAPAENGSADVATPRVLTREGSFLLAVGNPAGAGPQVVPQTRVQGSDPFPFEVEEGEAFLVIDFYYSAAGGLGFRAAGPDGAEAYGLERDGSFADQDLTRVRHVQARVEAAAGAWTVEPHAFQARAQAEYVFVVSLFRGEPPEDYAAPQPA